MTSVVTEQSTRLRALLRLHRAEVDALLAKYGVTNPRLFGSVARGDAGEDSDIDLMVDTDRDDPRLLWSLGGLGVELEETLGVKVDVVCEKLLREQVSRSVIEDLVAL